MLGDQSSDDERVGRNKGGRKGRKGKQRNRYRDEDYQDEDDYGGSDIYGYRGLSVSVALDGNSEGSSESAGHRGATCRRMPLGEVRAVDNDGSNGSTGDGGITGVELAMNQMNVRDRAGLVDGSEINGRLTKTQTCSDTSRSVSVGVITTVTPEEVSISADVAEDDHDVLNDRCEDDATFHCQICNKFFQSSPQLTQHLKNRVHKKKESELRKLERKLK